MVKVKNRYGDRYTGRMGLGIYQGRYGQQIRRRYTEKRKPRSELQKETEQRFREGVRFAKSLTSQEIATLKDYIQQVGLRTTWYNFAKKAVMQRAEISYTVYESPEFYWELSVYHPLLAKIEIYNAEDELIYGEDGITDLKQGYIENRRHLMGRQSIRRILIYSYSGKIYEEIVMVEDMSVYMRKDVYDVNDNGIVDNSEKLEGKTLAEIRADLATVATEDKIIYVDGDATEAGDGSSWDSPFLNVMDAINALPAMNTKNIEIWVAPKTGGYNENIDLAGHLNLGTITIKAMNRNNEELYDNGTATGGGSNYLDDTTKNWSADRFNGGKIFIYDGTGAGQIRDIEDTTGTRITVSSNWDTIPDNTSKYVILGLVKINGTITNMNLENLSLYGLWFSQNSELYTAWVEGVRSQTLNYCGFVNPTYRGIAIVGSMLTASYYNYIEGKDVGVIIQNMCTSAFPRASLILQTNNDKSGIGVQCQYRAFLTLTTNKNCIKGWDKGILAQKFADVYNGSVQNYINCTTNYAPSGSDDSAIT